tara:strand:+ start:451 stop:633 length:183 start_codon:yes stop_codon:yes gene_type:complete
MVNEIVCLKGISSGFAHQLIRAQKAAFLPDMSGQPVKDWFQFQSTDKLGSMGYRLSEGMV